LNKTKRDWAKFGDQRVARTIKKEIRLERGARKWELSRIEISKNMKVFFLLAVAAAIPSRQRRQESSGNEGSLATTNIDPAPAEISDVIPSSQASSSSAPSRKFDINQHLKIIKLLLSLPKQSSSPVLPMLNRVHRQKSRLL